MKNKEQKRNIRIAIHDSHNASVALMIGNEIVYAIQEERLTKRKNSGGFPFKALKDTLCNNKLNINEIEEFVLTGKRLVRARAWESREGVLEKYRRRFNQPKRNKMIAKIKKFIKMMLPKFVRPARNRNAVSRLKPLLEMGVSRERIRLLEHHLCHEAAAAYGWGLKDKFAVITSDAGGDNLAGTVSLFDGEKLTRLKNISVDDGITRLYSLTTYYLGMVPLEHEYKIMGMSPYAEDTKQARKIADYFHSLFEYSSDGLGYIRKKEVEPVKQMGDRLLSFYNFKRFDHISAGLQIFIEEFMTEWVRRILKNLNVNKVALSGGLFMNVKLNKKIFELKEVENVYVFPSCSDESNVFGALFENYYQKTKKQPKPLKDYCLGRSFSDKEINETIKNHNFKSKIKTSKKINNIEKIVAELIAKGNIVARFKGRMEFGARALGNRSILANPSIDCVEALNRAVKKRDFWMPFAPSMIEVHRYIKNDKKIKCPYMIFAFDTRRDKIEFLRSAIHPYDKTCRPQEVYKSWNSEYHFLINEFKRLTGESAILNTSFNLHGLPIVYTPKDALYVFDNSGLNYLAIGNVLIKKKS